jgi:hypothetical protein
VYSDLRFATGDVGTAVGVSIAAFGSILLPDVGLEAPIGRSASPGPHFVASWPIRFALPIPSEPRYQTRACWVSLYIATAPEVAVRADGSGIAARIRASTGVLFNVERHVGLFVGLGGVVDFTQTRLGGSFEAGLQLHGPYTWIRPALNISVRTDVFSTSTDGVRVAVLIGMSFFVF